LGYWSSAKVGIKFKRPWWIQDLGEGRLPLFVGLPPYMSKDVADWIGANAKLEMEMENGAGEDGSVVAREGEGQLRLLILTDLG